MGEEEGEGEGRSPLHPEYIRLIKIAIVAAIIIVALVIAVPFVQDALSQPRITVTETSFERVQCFFTSFQTYSYFFTLVNSGDADGFANVQFHLDGINLANANYFVPAGTTVDKSFNLQEGDCVDHTPEVVLAGFWKA